MSPTSSLIDRYEPFIAWRYLYRRPVRARRVRTLLSAALDAVDDADPKESEGTPEGLQAA